MQAPPPPDPVADARRAGHQVMADVAQHAESEFPDWAYLTRRLEGALGHLLHVLDVRDGAL